MFQVRIHGRGGQGAVSAAEINSVKRFLGDEGTITVEKMALDDKGFPQPTGEYESARRPGLRRGIAATGSRRFVAPNRNRKDNHE